LTNPPEQAGLRARDRRAGAGSPDLADQALVGGSVTKAIKQKLLADFHAVVTEADQLLKFVTDEGGDKANALRTKVEKNLNAAKEGLRSLEDALMEKTKATARATDEYVHENPWQTVGIAAGLSVVLGVVIGLLLYRR
jgi:ElaB/YqjD/DUF883 family membrane-anchored ribosome-binding protein